MENQRVLGIEMSKYAKICYLLILVASGYGLFANLAMLIGVNIPMRLMFNLLGLVGIALATTAYVGFKEKFDALDASHFLYMMAIFIAFLVLGALLGAILINSGAIGVILLFLLTAFQFAIIYTGFVTYQNGELATKDILIKNFKNLKNSLNKKNL